MIPLLDTTTRLQSKEAHAYLLYERLVRENPKANYSTLLRLLEKEWPLSNLRVNIVAPKRARVG